MEKKTLEVGDYLYYEDNSRYATEKIKSVEISKVGHKYYTAGGARGYKVDKTDLIYHADVGNNIQFFTSEQFLRDDVSRRANISKIRSFFKQWGDVEVNLQQTEQILSIINSNQDA